MPTINGDNGVSMGGYDYGVATLKYCYILAGSKDPLNSYYVQYYYRSALAYCKT
jgi:hypothetical protein